MSEVLRVVVVSFECRVFYSVCHLTILTITPRSAYSLPGVPRRDVLRRILSLREQKNGNAAIELLNVGKGKTTSVGRANYVPTNIPTNDVRWAYKLFITNVNTDHNRSI